MRGRRRPIERRWKQVIDHRLENNIVEAGIRRMDMAAYYVFGHPGSNVSQRYADLNMEKCAK